MGLYECTFFCEYIINDYLPGLNCLYFEQNKKGVIILRVMINDKMFGCRRDFVKLNVLEGENVVSFECHLHTGGLRELQGEFHLRRF